MGRLVAHQTTLRGDDEMSMKKADFCAWAREHGWIVLMSDWGPYIRWLAPTGAIVSTYFERHLKDWVVYGPLVETSERTVGGKT